MLTFVSYESEASRFPTGDALDPSGPDASEKEAFPRLSPDQVERLIAFGVVQQLPRGNAQHVMYVHGRHQFTGELNIFNERAVLVGEGTTAQCLSTGRPGSVAVINSTTRPARSARMASMMSTPTRPCLRSSGATTASPISQTRRQPGKPVSAKEPKSSSITPKSRSAPDRRSSTASGLMMAAVAAARSARLISSRTGA